MGDGVQGVQRLAGALFDLNRMLLSFELLDASKEGGDVRAGRIDERIVNAVRVAVSGDRILNLL